MPNYPFVGNNVTQFPGSTINTDALTFDSLRVPYSMLVNDDDQHASFEFPPVAGENTWGRFTMHIGDMDSNTQGIVFALTDSDDNKIAWIQKENYTLNLLTLFVTDGVSIQSQVFTNPLSEFSKHIFNLQLTIGVTNVTARVIKNNIVEAEAIIQTNQGPVSNPTKVVIGGGCSRLNNPTDSASFSEIIVADGSTEGSRLDLLRPAAAGNYTDWAGSILSLADDDPTTGMTTIAPDQSLTSILSAYNGSSNVSAVITMTTTTRGVNSPSNVEHLLRLSGVDYLSGQYPVDFSLDSQLTQWSTNPATSLPWTASDLAALEFGFTSRV